MIASLSLVALLAHPQIAAMDVPHAWSALPAIAALGGLVLGSIAWFGGLVLMAVESQRFLAIGMWEAGQDLGLAFSEGVPPDFKSQYASFQVFRVGYWHRVCNMLKGSVAGHGVIVCHVTCRKFGTSYAQVYTVALFSDDEPRSADSTTKLVAHQSDVGDCHVECQGGNLAVWRDLWCLGQMGKLVMRGQSEVVRQSVHQLLTEGLRVLGTRQDLLDVNDDKPARW